MAPYAVEYDERQHTRILRGLRKRATSLALNSSKPVPVLLGREPVSQEYPARHPISTTWFPLVAVAVAGLESLFFRSQVPPVEAAVLDWVPVVEEEVVMRAARFT